jgi:protein SCO1/2
MKVRALLKDIRVRTGLVIFFLLGIPLGITLFLRSGKNHYQSLPFYGPGQQITKKDTTYHRLPNFELASHRGDTFRLNQNLKGKNLVMHFFTAGCPGNCPEIFRKLKGLSDEYQNLDNLNILSVTKEPLADRLADLKQFGKTMNILNDQWHLTRGSQATTQILLREGFAFNKSLQSTRLLPGKNDLNAMNALFLVDKKGRIRGVYNGSDRQNFNKLKDEVRVLFVKQNLEYASSQ